MFKYFTLLFFTLLSCNVATQRIKTPKEFLNYVEVDSSIYSRDKRAIYSEMYEKMKKHEATFTNPEYFDSTELIIDTIIYDKSLNKIAIFIIAKNPTSRNPHSDSKLPNYYNANCYLGKRKYADSTIFELMPLGPFSLINFHDKELISKAIRDYYLLELATVLDENKQPVFKYNLDDERFWESKTGWKRVFD